MTASTARALLCAGDLYLQRFAAGVPGPIQGPYESDKFALTPKSTVQNAISKSRNGYGQVVEAVAVPGVSELEIDLTEVNKQSLAIALLGDDVVNSVASTTLAAQAMTLGALGDWHDTGVPNLTVTLLTNSGGTTTYDEGTDYIVEPNNGWIKPLIGGAMTATEAVKVTGTGAAFDETVISGMTDSQLRVRATFNGQNLVDGSPIIVTCYEVVLAASAVIDFLLSTFNKVTLKGSCKTPAGFTTPYIVKMRDPG